MGARGGARRERGGEEEISNLLSVQTHQPPHLSVRGDKRTEVSDEGEGSVGVDVDDLEGVQEGLEPLGGEAERLRLL